MASKLWVNLLKKIEKFLEVYCENLKKIEKFLEVYCENFEDSTVLGKFGNNLRKFMKKKL